MGFCRQQKEAYFPPVCPQLSGVLNCHQTRDPLLGKSGSSAFGGFSEASRHSSVSCEISQALFGGRRFRETNLYHLTICEAAALLESRELSLAELTRAFPDRIEAMGGQLRSFIAVLKDEALTDARLVGAEILRGDYKLARPIVLLSPCDPSVFPAND